MKVKLPSVIFEEKEGFVNPVFFDLIVGLHDMQDTYSSITLNIEGVERDCVKAFFNDNSIFYVLMDLETFDEVRLGMAIAMNKTYDYSEFQFHAIKEIKLN